MICFSALVPEFAGGGERGAANEKSAANCDQRVRRNSDYRLRLRGAAFQSRRRSMCTVPQPASASRSSATVIALPRHSKLSPAQPCTQSQGSSRSRAIQANGERQLNGQPAMQRERRLDRVPGDRHGDERLGRGSCRIPARRAWRRRSVDDRSRSAVPARNRCGKVTRRRRAQRNCRFQTSRERRAPSGWANGRSTRWARKSWRWTSLVDGGVLGDFGSQRLDAAAALHHLAPPQHGLALGEAVADALAGILPARLDRC